MQNVFYCFHFSINDAMNVLASTETRSRCWLWYTRQFTAIETCWGKLEMAKFWKLKRTSERKRNNYFPSVWSWAGSRRRYDNATMTATQQPLRLFLNWNHFLWRGGRARYANKTRDINSVVYLITIWWNCSISCNMPGPAHTLQEMSWSRVCRTRTVSFRLSFRFGYSFSVFFFFLP